MVLPTAKVAVACLPMAAWGIWVQRWLDILSMSRTALKVMALGGEMCGAIAVFVAGAAIFRCEEWEWVLALLRRLPFREAQGKGRSVPRE